MAYQNILFDDEYTFKNESCYHCSGFYGPSFGQPICSTCHAFVYPVNPFKKQPPLQLCDQKADECDSGNEEPKESQQDCTQPTGLLMDDKLLTVDPRDFLKDSDSPSLLGAYGTVLNDHAFILDLRPVENSGSDSSNAAEVGSDSDEQDESRYNCPRRDKEAEPIFEQLVPFGPYRICDSEEQRTLYNRRRKRFGRLRKNDSITTAKCSCSGGQAENLLQERLCLLTNPVRYAETEPPENALILPPEVWMLVFRLVDDVTLWQCTRVCSDWRRLILSNYGHNRWRNFTMNRWRFFKPLYTPVYWHAIFASLMESAPCPMCQAQNLADVRVESFVEANSWRLTRLMHEKPGLASDPPEGIEAMPLDSQYLRWQATIRGPVQSPYQGGTFFLFIIIPPSYPLCPPIVRFQTKIFHPNVSRHGDIGIDSIQNNWSLALTLSKVLISIQSLLTDPYTKVCMEPSIGHLYDSDRARFDKIAMEWTWRYAMIDTIAPKPCPDELRLCEAANDLLDDRLPSDLNPLLLGPDDDQENSEQFDNEGEQDNNDQEQDNNDQEQDNNEPEPDNNDNEH